MSDRQERQETMKKTAQIIEYGEYKGNPTLSIWNVDARGNPLGKTPVVSFGAVKARAILDHIEEIEEWVAEQEANKSMRFSKPMLSETSIQDLSPEDLSRVQAILNKSLATQGHKKPLKVMPLLPRTKTSSSSSSSSSTATPQIVWSNDESSEFKDEATAAASATSTASTTDTVVAAAESKT